MEIQNLSKTSEQADSKAVVEIRELIVAELEQIGGGHGVVQSVITP
jgi:hypothetical protein